MFPDTPWTLIAAATLHGDGEGRSAMESLCASYYAPVRSFMLWNGRQKDEADDLTQAFFLHVCEKEIMQRADKERGKFRSFIIGVLKHFLSHADRATATKRRGGEVTIVALDEVDDPAHVPEREDDAQFDQAWALALMDKALERVADEIVKVRGVEALQTLRLFLSTQQTAPTYETAAEVLGMTTAAAKMDIMRAEIGRTVSAPYEIEKEFQYLRQVLTT